MALMSLRVLVMACVCPVRQSAMDILTVRMVPMKHIVVCRLRLISMPSA